MKRRPIVLALFALTAILVMLAGCDGVTATPSTSVNGVLLPMSTDSSSLQAKSKVDSQAAATAVIMRADAQSTLDAVNATLSVAETQQQGQVDIVAAQIAATNEYIRANAQATLVAAGSTQSAAQTQDAIRQTQVQSDVQMTADLATRNAVGTVTQQNSNFLANSTQTSVANLIATQTQSAVATSQSYSEERQAPLLFLWLWCPPFFILALVLICLWFFWRWMKIREMQQRLEMLPSEPPVIIEHEALPPAAPNNQYPLTKPNDNVRKWLDEVKHKLNNNKEADDDTPER